MSRFQVKPKHPLRLRDVDPSDTSAAPGNKEETAEHTLALQTRLGELQELLFAEHKHRVLVILQGMDTSGKDGTLRKVLAECSPQGLRVVSFKAPTEVELDHDFLWRVHHAVPVSGEMTFFNRSHYEDVLVVRVHSKKSADFWAERFEQINAFESMLARTGTTILKFFLHISRDEQRERLQTRVDDPTKRWKFQHGDLAERLLWDDYMTAYEDALNATSTKVAPWYVVPADKKWFRNYVVCKTIVNELESLGMEYPNPDLGDVNFE